MTTADFGICPVHGPVAAKHDFSVGVIVVCVVLTVLFGIGLLILIIYVLYVLFSKDRIRPFCGSRLADGPVPVPVYPMPYYAPAYYPYPSYPPQPPRYPPVR
jgi:hypothetical protein